MKRRSKASETLLKSRRRKRATPKRRLAPKPLGKRSRSASAQGLEAARLRRELKEALERQAATAEILRLISSSPTGVQPVFDAIARNFVLLCGSVFGAIYTLDGELIHLSGSYGFSSQQLKALRTKYPVRVGDHSVLSSRAISAKRPLHIQNVKSDPNYDLAHAAAVSIGRLLAVPLLRDGSPLGAIVGGWAKPGPTPKKHEELLRVFADQAVIAIENARLLQELHQRTDDLAESLEQQTATSGVLEVISSSPGDLKPVFESILENAVRLCGAKFGNLYLREADGFRAAAMHNAPPAHAEQRLGILHPSPNTTSYRATQTKRPVQIEDITKLQAYVEGDPWLTSAVSLGGHRGVLSVPMLHEEELIGVITIFRQEAGAFTEKQIELLTNFARQAVIAIENTRLLNELRESLEQQTATADVLRVISSSPGELEPVFQKLLGNATRLCVADFGFMFRYDGSAFELMAQLGGDREYVEYMQRAPFRPGPETLLGRVLKARGPVQIEDFAKSRGFLERDPLAVVAVERGGVRTLFGVPMMRDDELIGVIAIYRREVHRFTEKQISLAQNFAAQAVIAIENARLLNELRESLDRQTATADVLRVISSSPSELQPVFQAILENASRICEAKYGNLYQYADGVIQTVASHSASAALAAERLREPPFRPGPDTAVGRVIRTKAPVHIIDVLADPGYPHDDPLRRAAERGGVRTVLSVPMLKENELVGAITIVRQEVRPFTAKQIELLMNFAAQAVIAIENARLLNELRESLDRQTATSEILSSMSGSVMDTKPVFDAILRNLLRLFGTSYATILLSQNGMIHLAALDGESGFEGLAASYPLVLDETTSGGRAMLFKQAIQFAPLIDNQAAPPATARFAREYGYNSIIAAPMNRGDEVIGAIVTARREPIAFDDKQVALIKSFAAQAVIAIENTRLVNELRQSLQQQTATADVLKIISRSTFDLTSVLQTLVESAAKLCDAEMAATTRQINGLFYRSEFYGFSREFIDHVKDVPIKPDRTSVSGRALAEGKVVQIPDVKADPEYTLVDVVKLGGFRTALAVPMLREGTPIGVLSLVRSEVRPFTDKQIELVATFADQAVIAIENARLLSELRESLQQQTATADVLKVISRSTFDLQAVLNTLADSAVRLCEADIASIHRQQGSNYQTVAINGTEPEVRELILRTVPFVAGKGSVLGRTVAGGRPIQIPDVLADPDYSLLEVQRKVGFRTIMGVPILREGNPIGVVVLMRLTVRPFSEKQTELATTFADQAGIAIENVRLFDEIQEKSRQLEEASKHKSQFLANMSHELRTPLNAILGYTELMADGAYGEPSEKMNAVLKRLESNGRHLLGLINDVLDLSKIEAGQLMLELSDYSIQDIAQTVRSTLEPLAADKKLGFKVQMPPDLPAGHGDGRRLTQVLINLVGNAIKFTDAGEVAIAAETSDGQFNVSVRDTGPGISAADQAKLFQEFQQADNSITRKKGGTGLGLAISKRIIEMHGGRIWIDSTIGQGSTFSFTLPVRVDCQVETAMGAQ